MSSGDIDLFSLKAVLSVRDTGIIKLFPPNVKFLCLELQARLGRQTDYNAQCDPLLGGPYQALSLHSPNSCSLH